MPKYRQDDAFKLQVEKLAALAFIQVSDLVATLESLPTSSLMMSYDSLPTLKTRGQDNRRGETPSNLQYKREDAKRKDPELGCLLSNNMM